MKNFKILMDNKEITKMFSSFYAKRSFKLRLITFIRHFRLFSKRCPKCNGFKENGEKHTINNCCQQSIKRLSKKLEVSNIKLKGVNNVRFS